MTPGRARPSGILVIAEIGSTHDGSLGIARNSVEVAAGCGVDLVKFQTHLAEAETTRSAPPPPFFDAESRVEYFRRTGFSRGQWQALREHARQCGVGFVSSPFSVEAVALLEEVGVERYKVPSGEVTNRPLLEEIARTGKPVLLSSGMSDWRELDAAVEAIRRHHDRLTVLQCTSLYPCPYERVGLEVMLAMAERYGSPVGFSDHTLTNFAALAAATLGAAVIEKHFTLSRHLYGSDARHSAEPPQFRELVEGVRAIEAMLAAPVDKDDLAPFAEMKRVFEKSVVSVADIPRGATITRGMLGIKKPGTGIRPDRLGQVVGRRAARDIPTDTVVTDSDLL
ncbi:MAG: N-acetylneuraminate synthase [Candidatus Rokubacteria bacterium RIFCSPLOWO2_12_FULL_71_19]|nr:MAG: N-acetylneuraminate synthase [Candidatus Rokubacteria bacterium RIFCSPLOWO2_12_FULL_71_19]